MHRRGFVRSLIAAVASLLGIGKAPACLGAGFPEDPNASASSDWLKEQMVGLQCLRGWELSSIWFSQVDCGAGTCPTGPEEEGFRAIILTSRHRYTVVARLHYLGCVCCNRCPDRGETWTRGYDLADGKRTVETWRRIVTDIERMEMTGSKYKE